MSQLLVQNYLNEIDRLRRYTGSVTEGVISEAFKDLLKAWSWQLNWQFSAQCEFATTQRIYRPFVASRLSSILISSASCSRRCH